MEDLPPGDLTLCAEHMTMAPMTLMPLAPPDNLNAQVAEEIRGWMGKRKVTGAGLARMLGVSQMWVSDRLAARTPIDLVELPQIATALGITWRDLLPSGRLTTGQYVAESQARPHRPTVTSPRGIRSRARLAEAAA